MLAVTRPGINHGTWVMPFGLCNAPATFQHWMENVLSGLAWDKCIICLDDILVIGQMFQEHMENQKLVFIQKTWMFNHRKWQHDNEHPDGMD